MGELPKIGRAPQHEHEKRHCKVVVLPVGALAGDFALVGVCEQLQLRLERVDHVLGRDGLGRLREGGAVDAGDARVNKETGLDQQLQRALDRGLLGGVGGEHADLVDDVAAEPLGDKGHLDRPVLLDGHEDGARGHVTGVALDNGHNSRPAADDLADFAAKGGHEPLDLEHLGGVHWHGRGADHDELAGGPADGGDERHLGPAVVRGVDGNPDAVDLANVGDALAGKGGLHKLFGQARPKLGADDPKDLGGERVANQILEVGHDGRDALPLGDLVEVVAAVGGGVLLDALGAGERVVDELEEPVAGGLLRLDAGAKVVEERPGLRRGGGAHKAAARVLEQRERKRVPKRRVGEGGLVEDRPLEVVAAARVGAGGPRLDLVGRPLGGVRGLDGVHELGALFKDDAALGPVRVGACRALEPLDVPAGVEHELCGALVLGRVAPEQAAADGRRERQHGEQAGHGRGLALLAVGDPHVVFAERRVGVARQQHGVARVNGVGVANNERQRAGHEAAHDGVVGAVKLVGPGRGGKVGGEAERHDDAVAVAPDGEPGDGVGGLDLARHHRVRRAEPRALGGRRGRRRGAGGTGCTRWRAGGNGGDGGAHAVVEGGGVAEERHDVCAGREAVAPFGLVDVYSMGRAASGGTGRSDAALGVGVGNDDLAREVEGGANGAERPDGGAELGAPRHHLHRAHGRRGGVARHEPHKRHAGVVSHNHTHTTRSRGRPRIYPQHRAGRHCPAGRRYE